MKTANTLLGATLLALAFGLTVPVHAQTAAAPAAASPGTTELTEAEVRKVDKENKKITLKHGAIKTLDMPPMTMVFQVTDPKMLDKVKTGDKIRFAASNDGGKFTVTEIQPAK